jgi:hypothetical protein
MRKVTRHNVVRQQSFSDRLLSLMTRYTKQHLTAAQVIAELASRMAGSRCRCVISSMSPAGRGRPAEPDRDGGESGGQGGRSDR